MAFFLSKIRQILVFLILFNLSSTEFINKNNLIYSPLFSQENLGNIHKIFYQNDKKNSNLIILSEDSVSSANLLSGEINYRKKINKLSEIVSVEPKNFFFNSKKKHYS